MAVRQTILWGEILAGGSIELKGKLVPGAKSPAIREKVAPLGIIDRGYGMLAIRLVRGSIAKRVMKLPVDIHTHTIASTHAYSTIHDYIAEARRKGVRLFATTDHGPDMPDAPHLWHFGNLHVIPRLVDGVGILRGIETNIRNQQGDIDCHDGLLSGLDIVLAGLHEPVFPPSTALAHTKAFINAMESGRVDVIVHPGNPNFPIDIPEVVKSAVACKVAIEINNSSLCHSRRGSRGNCLAIAEAARDLGATLVLGTDSHIAYTLGDFTLAEQLIIEAGFPEARILNLSPRRLLDFLEQRGHEPIAELSGL